MITDTIDGVQESPKKTGQGRAKVKTGKPSLFMQCNNPPSKENFTEEPNCSLFFFEQVTHD